VEVFGFFAFAALSVMQLWSAFDGATGYFGVWCALALFSVCLAFRFTMPLMAAGFLGAWVEWGWWWPWAALLMTPMLATATPALLADTIVWWSRVLLSARR
jgi:hypothetical protein